MLRDVLTSIDGVSTWPCDEINYIWRHGNKRFVSDELLPEHATPQVCKYIRQQFDLLAKKMGTAIIVEKTCANALRLGFVDKIFPDAKYVLIYRDGLDVVGSALKRWKAPLDFKYIAKKARYVPKTDLLYYGSNYLLNRIYKLFSKNKQLSVWGPVIDGLNELKQSRTVEEICTLQWKSSIDNTRRDLENIHHSRVFTLTYENFVKDPIEEFAKLAGFLEIDPDSTLASKALSKINESSVNKGRLFLGETRCKHLGGLIEKQLKQCGYVQS
jgi:hypothetical protein